MELKKIILILNKKILEINQIKMIYDKQVMYNFF